MELTARIHVEDGGYWADVPELPGCFASGDTLDELFESLQEGVALCLAEAEQVLAERTSIVLDSEEAVRFLAALDDPAAFEPGHRVDRFDWRHIRTRTT